MLWAACLHLMNAGLRVTRNSVIDMKKNERNNANTSKTTCSRGQWSNVYTVKHLNFQCLYRCRKKEQSCFIFPHRPSLFFFQDNANEKDFLFTKHRTNFMKLKLSPDTIELVDLISLLLFLCKSVSSCCEHNSLITHILGVPCTEG